jgi:hypothetical protein
MRKSYGFHTFRCLELALYHSPGKLPEPEFDPRILLMNLFFVPGMFDSPGDHDYFLGSGFTVKGCV